MNNDFRLRLFTLLLACSISVCCADELTVKGRAILEKKIGVVRATRERDREELLCELHIDFALSARTERSFVEGGLSSHGPAR